MNKTLDLKYENSSDKDEKKEGEGTSISHDAPLTGIYKSVCASQPARLQAISQGGFFGICVISFC